MAKLTKRAVDALAIPPNGQVFLWDGEMRGFGVRALPSGLKTYVLQYRAAGRSRRLVLGRHGVLTVEQARNDAREKLVAVTKGLDPAMGRADAGRAITVAQVCDWYLAAAAAGELLGRKRRPIKASTLAMDRSRIEQHIKPLLGARQVRSLTLADIESAQASIAAGRTARARNSARGGRTAGGPGVASRTMSTLHALLEHAMRLGKVPTNPARGVRRLAGTPRERRLTAGELTTLGKAINEAKAYGEHPLGLAAIRLLLLTGFRRQEALGLRRDWIDLDGHFVRFPDTKAGPQIRVLGQAAVVELRRLLVAGSSPFVFPADWGDGHFTAVSRTLSRLCAEARLEGVTPHVLRHTFASVAGELGFSELTIAALLGHAARGVTQRYVHIDEAVRMAADRVSAQVSRLLDERETAQTRKASGVSLRNRVAA